MKIIVLQEHQEKALEKSLSIIKNGGLVVIPTDTVYGIVGNATQAKTVERLYALKARPKEKAFPLFVRDIAMARWFAYISDAKARFLEHVWPGAVTVIFHHKGKLPQQLTAGNNSIAIRVPNHPFVLGLLGRVNIPLMQSSANLSGMPPATCVQEIVAYFKKEKNKPNLIIDGGELSGVPSTIIDLTHNDPRIIRGDPMNKDTFEVLLEKLSDAGL